MKKFRQSRRTAKSRFRLESDKFLNKKPVPSHIQMLARLSTSAMSLILPEYIERFQPGSTWMRL